jgi:hypothetical protein
MIKDIFDRLPLVPNFKDSVGTIDFFMTVRKDHNMRKINTAIAREPDGESRIPRESFNQVFDRMEKDQTSRQIDWATIVEYFTKRGRPLTKEELFNLQEEDQMEKDAQEHRKKVEEEASRRKMARLLDDNNEKENFEEYELRQ